MVTEHTGLKIAERGALAHWVADRVAMLFADASAARGGFSLGLAGGSVAETFLPSVATAPIAWESGDIFWCDERDVPVDDPASNYGRALQLLGNVAQRARLHPMFASRAAQLSDAATSYARTLEALLGRPPVFDVVLLGVGEDGHVASLFPRSRAAAESKAWVAAVTDSPKPPPRRLTLTMPVLSAARVLCVAAFGTEKAQPLRDAVRDPSAVTPLAQLLRSRPDAWVLLDHDAASLLAP